MTDLLAENMNIKSIFHLYYSVAMLCDVQDMFNNGNKRLGSQLDTRETTGK